MGSLQLQEVVTGEVVTALQAPVADGGGGLTEEQTAAISTGALALPAGLRLTATDDISLVAPVVAKGAIGAVGASTTGLDTDSKKIKIAKLIAQTVIKALSNGRMDNLATETRQKLAGNIGAASIGALKSGGITSDYMAVAALLNN